VLPTVVVGHSIGAVAAAHVAGVFGVVDAVRLVAARSRLMQALPSGGVMVAVRATELEITPLLTEGVAIAAVNGPSSIVLSGVESEVVAVVGGYRHKRLAVSHAFHSPLMDPMLEEFQRVAESVEYHLPLVRFVSTVTGHVEHEAITTPGYWVDNARRTVRFADAITTAGVTTFVEVGPGGVLTALTDNAITMLRPNTEETRSALTALGVLHARGHHIDWQTIFRGAQVVDLPTYAFQHQRFWLEAEIPEPRSETLGSDDVTQDLDMARLVSMPEGTREAALLALVRDEAALVLGHTDADGIDNEAGFFDVGFSSLTAVELRNRLGTAIGQELPAMLLFDQPTPTMLAEYLAKRLSAPVN